MRLILVRHGESVANNTRTHNTRDEPLSTKGQEQADKIAQRLRNEHFDRAIVSPLPRAKETAARILAFHPAVPIVYDDRIRECDNGVMAGKPYGSREAEADRLGVAHDEFRPEQGESLQDLFSRLATFTNELTRSHAPDTVLIVAHGRPITFIIHQLHKKRSFNEYLVDNASVSIIDSNGDARLTVWNDTEHLEKPV